MNIKIIMHNSNKRMRKLSWPYKVSDISEAWASRFGNIRSFQEKSTFLARGNVEKWRRKINL
jgi:hypothetical protein